MHYASYSPGNVIFYTMYKNRNAKILCWTKQSMPLCDIYENYFYAYIAQEGNNLRLHKTINIYYSALIKLVTIRNVGHCV